MVLDGLRPDYITPELMPHLHALGQAGIVAERHHSVFPTMTRVNAASIVTGAYPGAHGLIHNTMFMPEIGGSRIDTARADELTRVEEKTGGYLLTATSLGEVLAQNGRRLFVASAVSPGATLLLNHKVAGEGIQNSRGLVLPETAKARTLEVLGPFPDERSFPQYQLDRWAVRAAIEKARQPKPPDVILLWLSEPDATEHQYGIGSPKTLEAVRSVDAELSYLLEGLAKHGLRERFNLFVIADHGFSLRIGGFNVVKLLARQGLHEGVTVVGNQIYVKDRDPEKVRRIVRALQQASWAGAIFTRAAQPGAAIGFVSGTLSFDLIGLQHARTADIIVDAQWTDQINIFGYPGTATSPGSMGHGTASPFDLQLYLFACGPDFKQGVRSPVPTGNVDLAPTLLYLLGITSPKTMQGRVLNELLRNGPLPEKVPVHETVRSAAATVGDMRYELELTKLVVGDFEYLHFIKTQRQPL